MKTTTKKRKDFEDLTIDDSLSTISVLSAASMP
jgi:hypothetical protein